MNSKQKFFMWIGIIVFALMCLFPPTDRITQLGKGWRVMEYYYYSFFFQVHDSEIGLLKLLIQCFVVGILTMGFVTSVADKKEDKPKKEDLL